MGWIYQIKNTQTGQIYVGKTSKSIDERFSQHIMSASRGSETYLHRSIRFYGNETFELSCLEECHEDELDNRERYWIQELNSLAPIGFNMTLGGDGGDTSDSPAYRDAMKRRNMAGENNPNYGKLGNESPNWGKSRSEAQKMNHKNGALLSWKDAEARRELIRSKMTGQNNHQYGKKPKNAITISINGVEYRSIAEASRATGMSPFQLKRFRR